jgi:hypothetical protein
VIICNCLNNCCKISGNILLFLPLATVSAGNPFDESRLHIVGFKGHFCSRFHWKGKLLKGIFLKKAWYNNNNNNNNNNNIAVYFLHERSIIRMKGIVKLQIRFLNLNLKYEVRIHKSLKTSPCGDTFLWNIRSHTDYTTLYPRCFITTAVRTSSPTRFNSNLILSLIR